MKLKFNFLSKTIPKLFFTETNDLFIVQKYILE